MRVSAGWLAVCASVVAMATVDAATPICGAWKNPIYESAKQAYPELSSAIDKVLGYGTVPWYTDNQPMADRDHVLDVLASCGQDTMVPLVVYGIPNKDCDAGFSNKGSNQNMNDYAAFITKLANRFPTQKMIYIVEPDAVGLTADGGCGVQSDYPKYLKYALETLSKNPNAEIYLDIGYWTLMPSGNPAGVARALNDIWPSNGSRVKGIALNTSNYQKNSVMIDVCNSFAAIAGRPELKCVVDTSRNNRGPTTPSEWCNARDRGMGVPPTTYTNSNRVSYFLWIKPPGASDGECTGRTEHAMVGPHAGAFFKEFFVMLWNNSYLMDIGEVSPV